MTTKTRSFWLYVCSFMHQTYEKCKTIRSKRQNFPSSKFFNEEFRNFKGSSDPNHFIFEINVGNSRIRHKTTLNLNDAFLDRLKIDCRFKFRVVLCRIRLFPTLISKIKWLRSGLPLNIISKIFRQKLQS